MNNRKSKVIFFLGFNGVTHPITAKDPFSEECMKWLRKIIIENSYIDIVIASNWRKDKSLDELKQILGKKIASRVIGVTPVFDESLLRHVRYQEVIKYLEDTNQEQIHWIAIDDKPGFYPAKVPAIFTNSRSGFSEEDYFKVIKKLLVILLEQVY